MTRPALGYIGLGLMGSAMAGRLLSLGYPLTVMANRRRDRVEALVAQGAREVTTAREVAAASDIVLLCMDTSASVESRMRGAEGVIAGLRPQALVIDFGTSLPESTLALAAEVAAAGGAYMDAPLGRTPAHAVEGKLNVMAGGAAAEFARAEPLFRDIGENVFHVGPLSAGHRLKLINNAFGMTTACAMAEAFAMADRAGIDRATLYAVMSAGPLRSGMMDFIKGYAVDGKPDSIAFSIANAAKDTGYHVAMTQAMGAPTRMGAAAAAALAGAVRDGMGEAMVPEITDWFTKQGNDA